MAQTFEGFTGSSPLARGLPSRYYFTEIQRADHPRSRGVYATGPGSPPAREGSSPLARGLPISPFNSAMACRIIPARAGFTPGENDLSDGPKDHPRSRGVYMSLKNPLPGSEGSSPLARGLLDHEKVLVGDGGIIPARAGFTR